MRNFVRKVLVEGFYLIDFAVYLIGFAVAGLSIMPRNGFWAAFAFIMIYWGVTGLIFSYLRQWIAAAKRKKSTN